MPKRDVGGLGESLFQALCMEEGIICNQSNQDKAGWDYILDFSIPNSGELLGVHDPGISCRVQVKSTDSRDRYLSIKLSNLIRMATLHTATFYVFIEFDGKNSIQRLYLVHMDQKLIDKVLKRKCELESQDKAVKFHKKKMVVRYDHRNLLDDVSGKSLEKRIKEYIGLSFTKYVLKKIDYLKKSGYKDGGLYVNFSIQGKDNLQSFFNACVSDSPIIKLESPEFYVKRHGHFQELLVSNDLDFSLVPIQDPVNSNIVFKKHTFSSPISFPCLIYGSPLIEGLEEFFVLKIKNDLISMEIMPYSDNCQLTVVLSGSKRYSYGQIKKLHSFLNLIKDNDSIIMDIYPFTVGGIELNCCDVFDVFMNEHEYCEKLIRILNYFDCHDSMLVSFGEYLNKDIEFINIESIVQGKRLYFCYEISYDSKIIIDHFNPNSAITMIYCEVGEYILVACILLEGKLELPSDEKQRLMGLSVEKNRALFESTEYSIKGKYIIHKNEFSQFSERRQEILKEHIGALDRSYECLVID